MGIPSSGLFCLFSYFSYKMYLTKPYPVCYNVLTKKGKASPHPTRFSFLKIRVACDFFKGKAVVERVDFSRPNGRACFEIARLVRQNQTRSAMGLPNSENYLRSANYTERQHKKPTWSVPDRLKLLLSILTFGKLFIIISTNKQYAQRRCRVIHGDSKFRKRCFQHLCGCSLL